MTLSDAHAVVPVVLAPVADCVVCWGILYFPAQRHHASTATSTEPAALAVAVDHAAGPGTMMELYLSMQSSTSLRALLAVRLKGLGTQVRAWLGSKHRRLAVGSHVHSFFCSLFLKVIERRSTK